MKKSAQADGQLMMEMPSLLDEKVDKMLGQRARDGVAQRPRAIQILPITDIGEVQPGTDLAALLGLAMVNAGITLEAGDIVVVTQKIVSKAEGRMVRLDAVTPTREAAALAKVTLKDPRLVELVLRESSAILRAVPNVLIARHRLGLVMANAGIDRSNIGAGDGDRALLLPCDPDASAQALATGLARFGPMPAVVISDSFGRPWRMGVVAVGIGAAGLAALADRRGERDRDGRTLEVTQIAIADLIASAAALVTGEGAEGIPAVIVRGYSLRDVARPASALNRRLEEDLFQ